MRVVRRWGEKQVRFSFFVTTGTGFAKGEQPSRRRVNADGECGK